MHTIGLLALTLGLGCRGDTPKDRGGSAVVCPGDDDSDATFTIQPYVQSVTPTSAWILWETDLGAGSRVTYGTDAEALDALACGDRVPLNPDGDPANEPSEVHAVHLTGLQPDTAYHYAAQTGTEVSATARFRTVPPSNTKTTFRLVAVGDSQRDDRHPEMFGEIIQDGVVPHLREVGRDDELSDLAAMVLHVGDLVDNGWIRDEWVDELFGPASELLASVPMYPVLGNHEGGSPHYFRYFQLPDNGVDEHYYTLDYLNLRLIALDSNSPFDGPEQLDWLDSVLEGTCDDPSIDFVIAQLHHPHRSELWTPGESDWAGDVVAQLETFSTRCAKPSIYLFGHTHGYSRGQSRDHQHLMVNVSSAGGALDRWGATDQADYDEFTVSQDHYGFVRIDVTSGNDPEVSLTRIDRGTPETPVDNVVSDTITLRKNNRRPDKPVPTATGSQCADDTTLTASRFTDPDGDAHQGAQWQVAADCASFAAPVADKHLQHENWYDGTDARAGLSLTEAHFDDLTAGSVCWRVRYRDTGLVWSAWSAGEPLTLTSCP